MELNLFEVTDARAETKARRKGGALEITVKDGDCYHSLYLQSTIEGAEIALAKVAQSINEAFRKLESDNEIPF